MKLKNAFTDFCFPTTFSGMLLLKLLPPCQANICSLRLRNPPFQTILLISLVFFFHSWIWQCSKWVWWFGHFRNRACKVRKLSSIFCWAFLTRSNCLSFFKVQLWNSTPNILLWRSGDSWDLRNSTFIFNMSWSCNIRSFLLFAKTICNMC